MWYEIIIVFLSQIDWMDVLLELCLFTCLKPLSLLEAPVCVIVGVELKICEEPPAGAAFKSWACKVFWATPVTVYATKPINSVSRHLNRSHCCHSRTTVLLWRLKTSITLRYFTFTNMTLLLICFCTFQILNLNDTEETLERVCCGRFWSIFFFDLTAWCSDSLSVFSHEKIKKKKVARFFDFMLHCPTFVSPWGTMCLLFLPPHLSC